jgi:hypothetical protein
MKHDKQLDCTAKHQHGSHRVSTTSLDAHRVRPQIRFPQTFIEVHPRGPSRPTQQDILFFAVGLANSSKVPPDAANNVCDGKYQRHEAEYANCD